jgi:accessory gene regulator B
VQFRSFCVNAIENDEIKMYTLNKCMWEATAVEFIDRLNNKLLEHCLQLLDTRKSRNSVLIEKVTYALMIMITEIEKTVLTVFVFCIMGWEQEFATAFVTLVSLRIFMGGFHCKTTLGCLLMTIITFAIILTCARYIILPYVVCEVVWFIVLGLIWKTTPIQSEKRVRYNNSQCLKFKLKALTVVLVLSRVLTVLSEENRNIVLFVLLYQCAEVGIVGFIQKYARKEEKTHAA